MGFARLIGDGLLRQDTDQEASTRRGVQDLFGRSSHFVDARQNCVIELFEMGRLGK